MINAVGIGRLLSRTGQYAVRALKMAPDFALGTGCEVTTNTLRASFRGVKNAEGKYVGGMGFKNFWTQLKNAFKASEAHNQKLIETEGGFFKAMWKNIKSIGPDAKSGWSVGQRAAKIAGKSTIMGGLKGVGKSLAGKLPLVGSLLMLAMEAPNIAKATCEGGIVTGAAEAVKAGARITGSMAGFAIGQALCPIPIVGGLIGAFIGDTVASFVVGKSYTEKKEEIKEEAKKELAAGATGFNTATTGFDTGTTNPFSMGGMTADQYMMYQLQQAYLNNPELFTQMR